MSKLAVIFPGIGYHEDKPLLYYGRKLAQRYGFECIVLHYGPFPGDVKGDPQKMRLCFETAKQQTEEQLSGTDWEHAEDVVFLSKSIGTTVAAAYAAEHVPKARCVYYTPVEESFSFMISPGIVFHGTRDPWADTGRITALSAEKRQVLYLTEDANHSLETGDVLKDLTNLKAAMYRTEAFLARRGIFEEGR